MCIERYTSLAEKAGRRKRKTERVANLSDQLWKAKGKGKGKGNEIVCREVKFGPRWAEDAREGKGSSGREKWIELDLKAPLTGRDVRGARNLRTCVRTITKTLAGEQ